MTQFDVRKIFDAILSLADIDAKQVGEIPGKVNLEKINFTPLEISHVQFDKTNFIRKEIEGLPTREELKSSDLNNFIVVNGFSHEGFSEEIKSYLKIHRLVIEDIVNVKHPPKIELLEDGYFFIFRFVDRAEKSVDYPLSVIVFHKTLILFSPFVDLDYGENLIDRLKHKRGVIRDKGIDYLLFSILDLVVDSYFPRIDGITEAVREIDQSLFDTKKVEGLKDLNIMREVLNIHFDSLYPLKDICTRVLQFEDPFVKKLNHRYFNDCMDHIVYLTDRINRLKESTSDVLNLMISLNGLKMNEIMKVLTMVSSIFIPLSFVCGLYGMNFDTSKSPYNMPELSWYFGYPMVLGGMFTLIIGMIIYFKKKNWF
jgi:magnesium transporter